MYSGHQKYLPPNHFKVLVGITKLTHEGKSYSVSRIIPQPKYNNNDTDPCRSMPAINDIALVELHNEIEYSNNVSCILLLKHFTNMNESIYFPQVTAMGWGESEVNWHCSWFKNPFLALLLESVNFFAVWNFAKWT